MKYSAKGIDGKIHKFKSKEEYQTWACGNPTHELTKEIDMADLMKDGSKYIFTHEASQIRIDVDYALKQLSRVSVACGTANECAIQRAKDALLRIQQALKEKRNDS